MTSVFPFVSWANTIYLKCNIAGSLIVRHTNLRCVKQRCAFVSPRHNGFWISFDATFEHGISALCKPCIFENLFENWWRWITWSTRKSETMNKMRLLEIFIFFVLKYFVTGFCLKQIKLLKDTYAGTVGVVCTIISPCTVKKKRKN